ncbi:MAG: polyisoprenoid-binding protein [Myxococcales bacterium]|nr:polyisoprenoid-binding protein [Myxococcales bacterium]
MLRPVRSALLSVAASVLLLAGSASALASDWEVDSSHSRVGFGIRHMMVSTVHGTFDKYTGQLALDDADLSKSKAHIEIDASSIDTGNAKRDEHLRSPDFFDVAHYPKITFDSTKVEKRGADSLSVTGNLTIRNVTKPVVLSVSGLTGEVKDPWGGVRRGASAQAKISRKDFGLNWNKSLDTGGVVLGDDVNIELEVELTKKAKS